MEKKRIIFLSAKSGGGHDGAARSLSALIEAHFPGQYAFTTIDIYNGKMDKALPFLARIRHHSDLVWRVFLWLTNHRLVVAASRLLMARYMQARILRQLPLDTPVAMLVAVHFNPAQLVKALAVTLPGAPRAVILATDYDPHWSWIGHADAIVVASDAGVEKASQVGYVPSQVLRLGVLPNEQAMRKRPPDMRPQGDTFRLLMVSGQDGTNSAKILSLVEQLDASPIVRSPSARKLTLDIYCGKNESLRRIVEKRAAVLQHLTVRAHGFVSGLHERIAEAHLVLLRASPQVLSECISAGVPVIAFDWSVHEAYQATLINREQIGFASKDVSAVLQQVVDTVMQPARYQQLRSNVAALADTFDAHQLLQHLFCAGREHEVAQAATSTETALPG